VRPSAGESSKTSPPPPSTTLDDAIGLRPASAAVEFRPPRIARRPPLPIDRRSTSTQPGGGSAADRSGSAAVERGQAGASSSRSGPRSTVTSVSGVDADVRQLIDEVRHYF